MSARKRKREGSTKAQLAPARRNESLEEEFSLDSGDDDILGGVTQEVEDNDSDAEGDPGRIRYTRSDRVVATSSTGREVLLPEPLMAFLKPHQREGVRFMWQNTQLPAVDNLRGCILAHSMGLGKTMQVFTLSYLYWSENMEDRPRILILAPKVTLANWVNEFRMWSTERARLPRSPPVTAIDDSIPRDDRFRQIRLWFEGTGGVLLMGYEMYVRFVNERTKSEPPEYPYRQYLTAPGPDLVVLDEGHRIKRLKSNTTQALRLLQTRRRVILTGYPLQNHLVEYWCMVDWIRPNYWDIEEFKSEYVEAIERGLSADACDKDREEMRNRLFMLTEDLKSFVQRKDQTILERELPPKQELVVSVPLTPIQKQLYLLFLASDKPANMLLTTSILQKICNHPDTLKAFFDRKAKQESSGKQKKTQDESEDELDKDLDDRDGAKEKANFEWASSVFTANYKMSELENSGKMKVLFQIIHKCLTKRGADGRAAPEKILVFSQFTETLDVIEKHLDRQVVPGQSHKWEKGQDYLRLDGTSSVQRRNELIRSFNAPENKRAAIFLISTRAGGIGINLVAASRVVVFDVCWNPCHDNQAIFRAYRYGQIRPVTIYRLVTHGTAEEKVFARTLHKMWLFSRVVDDRAASLASPAAAASCQDMWQLDENYDDASTTEAYKDLEVMGEIIEDSRELVHSVKLHQSLIIEDENERLSEDQKEQCHLQYGFLKDLKGKDCRAKDAQAAEGRRQRSRLTKARAELEEDSRVLKEKCRNLALAFSDVFGGDAELVTKLLDAPRHDDQADNDEAVQHLTSQLLDEPVVPISRGQINTKQLIEHAQKKDEELDDLLDQELEAALQPQFTTVPYHLFMQAAQSTQFAPQFAHPK